MSSCASVCSFAFFFSNIRSDTFMFVVISRSKSASTLPPFDRWMHWFLGNLIVCSDFSLTCWYNALFYFSPRAHTLCTITSEYCQHVMIENEKKNVQWMWPPITAFAASTGSPVCRRTQRFNFSFCLFYRSIESRLCTVMNNTHACHESSIHSWVKTAERLSFLLNKTTAQLFMHRIEAFDGKIDENRYAPCSLHA